MAYDSDFERQEALRRQRERRRRYEQRRRAHIRKQRIVFGGGGLLILLVVFLILRGCTGRSQPVSGIASTANLKVLPEVIWDPEDLIEDPGEGRTGPTITLAAVGDIMCYDEQLSDAMTGSGYDFAPAFAEVAQVLSSANLTVGNLETNIVPDQPYVGKPNFNTPPEMAQALAGAGFDLLSTANTYSIQYGINGLASTRQSLQQAGIDAVGTYYTQAEREVSGGAVIKDVGGIRVAFLAYTKGVNNMFLPEGYEFSVNLLYEDYYFAYTGLRKEEILADISAVEEAGADVIVCMLHWGSEYETELSDDQQEIADTLIEAGVDIILGSHSHVAGPVELRQVQNSDGSTRQALIAWSLGNFYSFMSREGTMESLILQVSMQLDDDGQVLFTDVDYVPICTSYEGEGEHFRVTNIPAQMEKYLAVAEDAPDEETYRQLESAAQRVKNRVGEDYKPQGEDAGPLDEDPEDAQTSE